MIGRGPLRRSHLLAASVLTAGLVWAGFLTSPSPAYAGSTVSHLVIFNTPQMTSEAETTAATVGDFLRQHGITIALRDYVSPAADTPLSDRMSIEYRPAVAVTIVDGKRRERIVTAAPNVASLLAAENVRLGRYDSVKPALSAAVPPGGVVRIDHYLTWQRIEHRVIPVPTIRRVDFSVVPGKSKVINPGRPGVREVVVSFIQHPNGDVRATVIRSRVLRKPHPHIVAVGAAESMQMVATAYTPYCGGGCSGITATGTRAGHGVVAVDPRVIPLGSRLYIPGYGYAIAGDTGGAIVGYRIDLGFESDRAAVNFGRRAVTVYRLK
ncbi:MAG TPA: ubiquitin-like domain-containing protein [Candidatus Baltobacteraceae bacterium]|nr:ubiquitin-like domain-containing protein [Candidatus Baltobacteraceae bacterium]